MLLPRAPRPHPSPLAALARGAGISIAVLSTPLHRGSLANAQAELFERRRRDLAELRAWRELEPRLQAGTGDRAGRSR